MSGRGDTNEFTLAAGGKQKFSAGNANYLFCYLASGLFSVQLIRNREAVERPHVMDQLYNLKGRSFDEFQIENISGASNTLRIFFGPGDYDPPADRSTVTIDGEVDANLVSGSVTLNQSNISNGALDVPDVSIGATATAAVVTASTNNVRIRVSNPSSNTQTMRIATHANVDSGTGTPLPPGSTWETNTQAGVWAYNPGGVAELLGVEVETRT